MSAGWPTPCTYLVLGLTGSGCKKVKPRKAKCLSINMKASLVYNHLKSVQSLNQSKNLSIIILIKTILLLWTQFDQLL